MVGSPAKIINHLALKSWQKITHARTHAVTASHFKCNVSSFYHAHISWVFGHTVCKANQVRHQLLMAQNVKFTQN